MVLPKYLLAVLSGIHLVFGMPKSGNFEVSISGAFEYPLARYPLCRNVSVSVTGKFMIMHNDDTCGYLVAVLSRTGL